MKESLNITEYLDRDIESSVELVLKEESETYSSTNFHTKQEVLKGLLDSQQLSTSTDTISRLHSLEQLTTFGTDTVVFRGWKNVENISARLIEVYDDNVILECLVDKDKGIYEEREFRASLFEGYNLSLGSLFYLRFFDRPNETRMEVHNDPKLSFKEDFPERDFREIFSRSKLFK